MEVNYRERQVELVVVILCSIHLSKTLSFATNSDQLLAFPSAAFFASKYGPDDDRAPESLPRLACTASSVVQVAFAKNRKFTRAA